MSQPQIDAESLLSKYNRIVIVGPPDSGKTTLSKRLNGTREIIHTDDFIDDIPWQYMPEFLVDMLSEKDKFVIEGCQCFRLIKKGMMSGEFMPDIVIHMRGSGGVSHKQSVFIDTLYNSWYEFINMNHKAGYPIEVVEW